MTQHPRMKTSQNWPPMGAMLLDGPCVTRVLKLLESVCMQGKYSRTKADTLPDSQKKMHKYFYQKSHIM